MLTGPPGPGCSFSPASGLGLGLALDSCGSGRPQTWRETLVRPRPYQCHGQAARLSARAEVTFAQISRGSQLRLQLHKEREREVEEEREGLQGEKKKEKGTSWNEV